MEVLENDKAGQRGRGDLTREIDRSECWLGGADSSEQHLMRLSGDPLLVREFLLRKDAAEPKPQAAAPMSGEVIIALGRGVLGSLDLAGRLARSRQYERREALLETSVSPSVFEPSCQDREGALEHDSSELGEIAPAVTVSRAGAALAVLPFAAILIVVLLLLVPN